GPGGPMREAAEGPRRDSIVPDAGAALGRPHAVRPVCVQALHERDRGEASRLDDVRQDAVHFLRHDVEAPERLEGPLALDEDEDARLVRVSTVDRLVPDRDPDDIRAGEDRALMSRLRGAHSVDGHGSSLPLEGADLEEALPEFAAGRGARDP